MLEVGNAASFDRQVDVSLQAASASISDQKRFHRNAFRTPSLPFNTWTSAIHEHKMPPSKRLIASYTLDWLVIV